MNRNRLALALAFVTTVALAETPDTLLVMKNGSEVRGQLQGIADGKITVVLADGRSMTYEMTEVERTEKIGASAAPAAPPAPPAPAAPAVELQPCNVFLTEGSLDPSLIKPMKEAKLSKKWYGGSDEMYIELAKHLQTKLKADGAINVHTWQAPSGFSWSAPHIGGTPFTWTEAGKVARAQLKGRCF